MPMAPLPRGFTMSYLPIRPESSLMTGAFGPASSLMTSPRESARARREDQRVFPVTVGLARRLRAQQSSLLSVQTGISLP